MRRWAHIAAVLMLANAPCPARAQRASLAELPPLTVPADRVEGNGPRVPSFRERVRQTPLGRFLLIMPSRPPTKATTKATADSRVPTSDGASTLEVLAAKIRRDEATVQGRIAALRYLATVPCQHMPEAEDALVCALRDDRNEAVRLEAAKSLAAGCCPTRRVMEHLYTAATGSTADGHPAELSARVRTTATLGLHRCLALCKAWTPSESGRTVSPPSPVQPVALRFAETTAVGDEDLRRWAETVGGPARPVVHKIHRPQFPPAVPLPPMSNVPPPAAAPIVPVQAPAPPPLTYIGQVSIPSPAVTLPLGAAKDQ